MNKAIIMSLALIAVVSVVATGATVAYFTDEETSVGNTFTAGQIDLKIDSHCTYNNRECANGYWVGLSPATACSCNWELRNLESEKFFDFPDIKPGDFGEVTVSFHGYSNDAFLYATITPTYDDDVSCVDPEIDAENDLGLTCAPGNDGELDENLYFIIWEDMEDYCTDNEPGDNKYCDTPGHVERILVEGYASEVFASEWYIGNLPTGDPYYIAAAWCVGGPFDPANPASCNGANVGNEAQTDSFMANIMFSAEQARHNTPRP
jgi:predicted ribosomally synthesized peptide with SipW-like signal peptide